MVFHEFQHTPSLGYLQNLFSSFVKKSVFKVITRFLNKCLSESCFCEVINGDDFIREKTIIYFRRKACNMLMLLCSRENL